MSTRSMVTIAQPYSSGPPIPLYRHCDGYLAESGAALIEVLRDNPPDTETVVCRLLAMRYDRDNGASEPIYRIANWQPESQGDLEHVYRITRPNAVTNCAVRGERAPWLIEHLERPGWDDASDSLDGWCKTTYTVAEFVKAVNRERKATLNRLKARGYSTEGYELIADVDEPDGHAVVPR